MVCNVNDAEEEEEATAATAAAPPAEFRNSYRFVCVL
jgi:hypothetical protein